MIKTSGGNVPGLAPRDLAHSLHLSLLLVQHLLHIFAQSGSDIGAFQRKGYRGCQQTEGSTCIIAFTGEDDAVTMPSLRLHFDSIGNLNLSTTTGRSSLQ